MHEPDYGFPCTVAEEYNELPLLPHLEGIQNPTILEQIMSSIKLVVTLLC